MPYILWKKIKRLCPFCRKSLTAGLPKPRKRGPKASFDRKAILAALKAGGTIDEVAVQIGCSPMTVRRARVRIAEA